MVDLIKGHSGYGGIWGYVNRPVTLLVVAVLIVTAGWQDRCDNVFWSVGGVAAVARHSRDISRIGESLLRHRVRNTM